MSEEYKLGFKEGWEAAIKYLTTGNYRQFPPIYTQEYKGCRVCGLGADGGVMGYVCPRSDCPSQVRCIS